MQNKTAWWDKPIAWYEDNVKPIVDFVVSGRWIVEIVTQMIITAGNIAESAFLLATLWVLINIAGHVLITWILDAHTIELINNLSSIAFAALPELLFLGVIKTCIGHFLTGFKRRDKVAFTWAALYLIPAVSFGTITVYVLSIASRYGLQSAIDMGEQWLIVRYLSGLFYAIIHSIDQSFARPHFASQMDEKDKEIKNLEKALEQKQEEMDQTREHFEMALRTANSNFQMAMQSEHAEFEYRINEIIEQGKRQIEALQNQLDAKSIEVQKLAERASSLERDELAYYPKVYSLWIEKAKRTVSIEEIIDVTGFSKQRIRAAITSGKIARDNRNKELFRVSSVVDWLKTIPVNGGSNGHGNGHLENEEDALELPVLTMLDSAS